MLRIRDGREVYIGGERVRDVTTHPALAPIAQRDPDMLVRVTKEIDAGLIIRDAKYETASCYADQAFLKPTVGAWTDERESDYALVRRAAGLSDRIDAS